MKNLVCYCKIKVFVWCRLFCLIWVNRCTFKFCCALTDVMRCQILFQLLLQLISECSILRITGTKIDTCCQSLYKDCWVFFMYGVSINEYKMCVNFRSLTSIQDRQVACYSVSCRERHNLGTAIWHHFIDAISVLWRHWLVDRKGIWPVKTSASKPPGMAVK